MTPHSTAKFYQLLIKKHFRKQQNQAYPEIIIYSMNFAKIKQLQQAKDKTAYIHKLTRGINSLEKAGAEFAVIAANTPHIVFPELIKNINIPLLHIVESTLNQAKKLGLQKLLLLGTQSTMQSSFYQEKFNKAKLQIITPSNKEQQKIDSIIFTELAKGIIEPESKNYFLQLISRYETDSVILGCTELQMLINQGDTKIKVLDTLSLHAEAALAYAYKD